MTIQQMILAIVPLIVLVVIIVVMARVAKDHPERLEALRTWGIVAGGIGLVIQLIEKIRTHN